MWALLLLAPGSAQELTPAEQVDEFRRAVLSGDRAEILWQWSDVVELGRDAVPPLLGLIRGQDEPDPVQFEAVRVLGSIQGGDAFEGLMSVIVDESLRERRLALSYLLRQHLPLSRSFSADEAQALLSIVADDDRIFAGRAASLVVRGGVAPSTCAKAIVDRVERELEDGDLRVPFGATEDWSAPVLCLQPFLWAMKEL